MNSLSSVPGVAGVASVVGGGEKAVSVAGGGGGAAAAYYHHHHGPQAAAPAVASVTQLKDALRNGVQVGHIDKLNNMSMCYNSWKRVGLIDMKRAGLVATARFNYND